MDNVFEVTGGKPLRGRTAVSGSKNASFPLLALALACDGDVHVQGLPLILDVQHYLEIIRRLGAISQNHNEATIRGDDCQMTAIDENFGSKVRASYYFLGSLLARYGTASVPQPGGCKIGDRPMDLHIWALRELGVSVYVSKNGRVEAKWHKSSKSNPVIFLPFKSRGVTVNLLLLWSRCSGSTLTIHNANLSPEVLCLVHQLRAGGCDIGQVNGALTIKGAVSLRIPTVRVPSDKIEAGTLACAILATRGYGIIDNVEPNSIQDFLVCAEHIGAEISLSGSSLEIQGQKLRPYSARAGLDRENLDADYIPPLAALFTTISDPSYVEDRINPGRNSNFLPELEKLGAIVTWVDSQAAHVSGASLKGAEVIAKDIRGGAALCIGALAASGQSLIRGVQEIDRGYESLESKLQQLGGSCVRAQGGAT